MKSKKWRQNHSGAIYFWVTATLHIQCRFWILLTYINFTLSDSCYIHLCCIRNIKPAVSFVLRFKEWSNIRYRKFYVLNDWLGIRLVLRVRFVYFFHDKDHLSKRGCVSLLSSCCLHHKNKHRGSTTQGRIWVISCG